MQFALRLSCNQQLSRSGNDSITWTSLWWSKETSSGEIIHSFTLMRVTNIHYGLAVMNEIPVLCGGVLSARWERKGCWGWKKAVGWLTKGWKNSSSDSYFKHVLLLLLCTFWMWGSIIFMEEIHGRPDIESILYADIVSPGNLFVLCCAFSLWFLQSCSFK